MVVVAIGVGVREGEVGGLVGGMGRMKGMSDTCEKTYL